MKSTSSLLHPHHALQVLNRGINTGVYRPEHIISMVGEILRRIDELDSTDHDTLRECMSKTYPELQAYAHASTLPTVKEVAGRIAFILDIEGDMCDFYYEAYRSGNKKSLFMLLDYLMTLGDQDRPRSLIEFVWDEWKDANHEVFLGENEQEFLRSLSEYAFQLSCDGIAREICSVFEGKVLEDFDPDILKYRRMIRSPEEYSLAMNEIFEFYYSGHSSVVSLELIQSARNYIESQLDYLKSNDCIEPTMLAYLEGFASYGDGNLNYHDTEGKNYFAFQEIVTLVIVHADATRAEQILSVLEEGDEFVIDMFSDIVRDHGLVGNEDDGSDIDDLDQAVLIFDGILVSLLNTFRGVEYTELHQRIYALMRRILPNKSQDTIQAHQIECASRGYLLNNSGMHEYYNSLVTEMNASYHPIRRMYVLYGVMEQKPLENSHDALIIAYYSMEYYILHGSFISIDAKIFEQMKGGWPMSSTVRGFFERYYNQSFPHVGEYMTKS